MCLSVISINKKKNVAKNQIWYSTFASYIESTLNFFINIGKTLCTGSQKIIQMHEGLLREIFVTIFFILDCTECNKINIHFCHARKHVNSRIRHE